MIQQRVQFERHQMPGDSFLLQTPSLASLQHPPRFVLPSPSSLRLGPSLLLFLLPQPISVLFPSLSPEVGVDPSWLQLPTSNPWASGHSSNIEGLVWVRPCSRADTQEELRNPRGSWEVSGVVIPILQVRNVRPRQVKSCPQVAESGLEARQPLALSMLPPGSPAQTSGLSCRPAIPC